MRPWALALLLGGCAPGAAPPPETPAMLVRAIDHIPVAVADLERAEASFAALGFTLKPGRAHANGIRNAHAKFADGSSIELITAPAAVDALTSQYRALIAHGNGPAFLALHVPDMAALGRALAPFGARVEREGGMVSFRAGDSLGHLFFGTGERSRTDRPEHFVHANGTQGIAAVWLAPSDRAETERLFAQLGIRFADAWRCLEICSTARVARIGSGELVLVDAARQRLKGRPIIGVTLRVDRGTKSRLVSPERANGIWLAFKEG